MPEYLAGILDTGAAKLFCVLSSQARDGPSIQELGVYSVGSPGRQAALRRLWSPDNMAKVSSRLETPQRRLEAAIVLFSQ